MVAGARNAPVLEGPPKRVGDGPWVSVRGVRTQRVLVTGMGAELGSQVAAFLEREPWVGELRGIDVDPPRRRLRTSDFHRVDPLDEPRVHRLVVDFDPEVVVHFGVWEPDARATPAEAARWSPHLAAAVFRAAAECPSLAAVVVRSGLEVYGRGGDRPNAPDETAPAAPTSPFGRELADVEARARLLGHERDVPVTCLRLAPVMGPHVPSPLGRLLRLPVVPVDVLGLCGRSRFSVVDSRDAATAATAAARLRVDGAVNLVGPGSVTVRGALRHGNRMPWPVLGPQWIPARAGARALGAPVPSHLAELLTKGRLADGAAATELLGINPTWTTEQVLDALYSWEPIVRVRPAGRSTFAAVEGS